MIPSLLRSLRGSGKPPAIPGASLQWVEVSGGPLKGHQLYIDPEVPTWRKMVEGLYEPFIFEALGGDGGYESQTVWDVGAHMGYHALSFAALVGPGGRVVTFEPNPFNCDRVRKNLSRNPDLDARVTLITEALSNQDGETTFNLSRNVDSGHSSGSHMGEALAPEDPSVYERFEKIKVKTARADTLWREGRVPPPTLIKMDVEGAEFLVLEGAVGILSELRPTLLIEVHHIVTMFQTQKLLADLGYALTIADEHASSPSRCHVLARPR
ncbi:MAG TPA: FkbM family methyltransferase [Pyrinomonadaceae bacterium]|nr:FkbM family methyltransferase [Pyrinomonadaceae bacterium]